ncbi:MAG: hypothetical protein QG668_631 [Patescibacteria group bacterium]|nr:hypothetical protein [Patescibacteria group bacterium]
MLEEKRTGSALIGAVRIFFLKRGTDRQTGVFIQRWGGNDNACTTLSVQGDGRLTWTAVSTVLLVWQTDLCRPLFTQRALAVVVPALPLTPPPPLRGLD